MVCIDPLQECSERWTRERREEGKGRRVTSRPASSRSPTHFDKRPSSTPSFSFVSSTPTPTRTVYHTITTSPRSKPSASSTSAGSSDGLSDSSIAAVAVGGIAVFFIIVIILSCVSRCVQRRRRRAKMPPREKRRSRWQVSGPQTPPWSRDHVSRGPGDGVGFFHPSTIQPHYPKMQQPEAGLRPNPPPLGSIRQPSQQYYSPAMIEPDRTTRLSPTAIGVAISPDTPLGTSPESMQSIDSTTNLLPRVPQKSFQAPIKHSPKRPPRPQAPWTIHEDHRERSPIQSQPRHVQSQPRTPPPAVTVTSSSPTFPSPPSRGSRARPNESKPRRPSPPQLVIPPRKSSMPEGPQPTSEDPFVADALQRGSHQRKGSSSNQLLSPKLPAQLQAPQTPLTPKTPVTNALQYYMQPPPSARDFSYPLPDAPLPPIPSRSVDSPTLGNNAPPGPHSRRPSSVYSSKAEDRYTYISSAPQSPEEESPVLARSLNAQVLPPKRASTRRSSALSRKTVKQIHRESDGSETSFESIFSAEEITPPQDPTTNPLSPARPLSVEKPKSPIVDVNYPKVPRSANQKVARSPPSSPPHSTLLQKRIGSNSAGKLEHDLVIKDSNISRLPTPVNEPNTKSPQRAEASPRVLRESNGNGGRGMAVSAESRSPRQRPPQGRLSNQQQQTTNTQVLSSPHVQEIPTGIKSPMWEPRLTPRRVGEDLILEVSRGRWDR